MNRSYLGLLLIVASNAFAAFNDKKAFVLSCPSREVIGTSRHEYRLTLSDDGSECTVKNAAQFFSMTITLNLSCERSEGVGSGDDKVLAYKFTNADAGAENKLAVASIAMLFHPKSRRGTGFAQTQDNTTYDFSCKVDRLE